RDPDYAVAEKGIVGTAWNWNFLAHAVVRRVDPIERAIPVCDNPYAVVADGDALLFVHVSHGQCGADCICGGIDPNDCRVLATNGNPNTAERIRLTGARFTR